MSAQLKNPAEEAVELFEGGLYCSEAILQTYNSRLRLGLNDAALRMATAFGAGLGGSRCLCGALSGAVLVASAIKGRTTAGESEGGLFELTQQLHDRFRGRFNATCCRTLTRPVEWGTAEHHLYCNRFVKGAVEILAELLVENSTHGE